MKRYRCSEYAQEQFDASEVVAVVGAADVVVLAVFGYAWKSSWRLVES